MALICHQLEEQYILCVIFLGNAFCFDLRNVLFVISLSDAYVSLACKRYCHWPHVRKGHGKQKRNEKKINLKYSTTQLSNIAQLVTCNLISQLCLEYVFIRFSLYRRIYYFYSYHFRCHYFFFIMHKERYISFSHSLFSHVRIFDQ